MKKLVTFASDIRLNALVCSSVAVLLTACGGNTTDGLGQQTQTAAYTYNSASTATEASAATAPAAGTDVPATEVAAADASTSTATGATEQASSAGFDLSGYGSQLSAAGNATAPADQAAGQAGANAPTRLLAMSVAVSTSATPQDQITQLYQSLLGRSPDPAGLAFWSQALTNGMTIEQITTFIKASEEYQALQNTGGGTGGDTGATIPATTYNYYVSPTGSDSNAGTKAAPFKTLTKAAQVATKPSTTVWVAPGTYAGGFKTTASGTSSGRIYWVSTTKWGAKVVPGSTSVIWDNRGSYVNIVGFDIDGSTKPTVTHGIYMGGSYDIVQNNHVHHIAKSATCNSAGGSAINTDAYYGGKYDDVIGNLVHDVGPAGCKYIQGIYISTSGKVQNNVVYRVGEAAIHLWHDATNVTITNNTVATSHYAIIVGGGNFYHNNINDYTVVNNNILIDNGIGISEQGTTGTHNSYSNNLVYGNGTAISLKNGLTAKNTVTSNPLFVSYSKTMTTPNFHLTSSSPAIGRGTPTGALSTDFDGKPRNASTGYDIGAYQH